ncbi:SDR family NAD(P)-dependent oxidoreductase [Salipiger bermudensis]|uniref:SDR family NAD(P)-dependent oxidoreductase n=1 Tax=Salipiger bermudensis TaxID=344736 RepID=UPI001CD7CC2A|nr:SDR family NAD(P)-dependent oxidoreductase [Salipiger bermudensis]MCA0961772.1 SDR family oxidoreductase [Salipiger bermudensis]
MMRFKDKVAIVTGGAGGIGSAICRRLAAEGALVRVVDMNGDAAEGLAHEIGGTAHDVDLTDPSAIRDFVDGIAAGGIHVLCNNAGLMRRGALMELTDDDWQASFAVNVDALFHMCQAVIPQMQAQGGGAIVNTASQWGLHPAPGHIAYNTTKAAVVAFTQNLARDYAPDRIRVNAVAPGEVRTPMLESNLARSGRSLDDLNRLVPYGRIGEPDEIAALVAFLASDEAGYLCGSVVEITGAQAVA